MTHEVFVTDATSTLGYGPQGHGSWRVECQCGWATITRSGGKNAADMVARDHAAHAAGHHVRPVYDCLDCPRF